MEIPKIPFKSPFKYEVEPPEPRYVMEQWRGREKEFRDRIREMHPSKSFFYDTPFGRTISGRNKAGRTIRRIGGGALAVGLSMLGVSPEFLQSANDVSQVSDIVHILESVERILIIIGSILYGSGFMSDKAEAILERKDEKGIENA